MYTADISTHPNNLLDTLVLNSTLISLLVIRIMSLEARTCDVQVIDTKGSHLIMTLHRDPFNHVTITSLSPNCYLGLHLYWRLTPTKYQLTERLKRKFRPSKTSS